MEQCRVEYDDEVVTVLANGEPIFQAQLEHPVDPATFQLKCTPSKVLLIAEKLSLIIFAFIKHSQIDECPQF